MELSRVSSHSVIIEAEDFAQISKDFVKKAKATGSFSQKSGE